MADDRPGKPQVGHLLRAGLTTRDDLPVRLRDRDRRRTVGRACPPRYAATATSPAARPTSPLASAARWLSTSDCVVRMSSAYALVVGGHDRLDEPARLGQHFGRRRVQRAVETQHRSRTRSRDHRRAPPAWPTASSAPIAAPQGLLCLMTTQAGASSERTIASALSRSSRLL